MNTFKNTLPKTGWLGFKENWKADLLSGMLVSLIALPLSLGIASASGFPPIMGVMTAIIGGVVVAFFAGSELTIKGPAAGMIVICAGAVEELGRGNAELGWKLALGAVVISGLIQILFGIFKVAKLADFFPLSAVHGMLAAIGIIIMGKQLHFVMGIAPSELKGKEPLELIAMLPHSIMNMNKEVAIIGLVSLLIMFGLPMIKNATIKKAPPALIVLIVAIVLEQLLHLDSETFRSVKPLVNPGEFEINFNTDFTAMTDPSLLPIFFKYLLLFTVIGSIESLLTGKAIDLLDPYKRKANLSKDLAAVGIGNTLAGLLGGLPMISEVARSSANINNGGKTRWANLFHGLFLLLFVVALVPIIKMIPVAALAAMLIFIGFKLAHPREFGHTYQIGKDQLAIFVVTIVTTLATDLLIGIGAGILLELIMHLANGVHVKSTFKPLLKVEAREVGELFTIQIEHSAVFSNWIKIKKTLNEIPRKKTIIIDLSKTKLIDHSVMENLSHYQSDYISDGGKFVLKGLEKHKAFSHHKLAGRKLA